MKCRQDEWMLVRNVSDGSQHKEKEQVSTDPLATDPVSGSSPDSLAFALIYLSSSEGLSQIVQTFW